MDKIKAPDLWFLNCIELLEAYIILYNIQIATGTHFRIKKPYIPLLELLGPINLIQGLCLETLFKACVCTIDPQSINKFTGGNGHNLKNIALYIKKNWKIMLTAEEITLLQELSSMISWKGKYPGSKLGKNDKFENTPVETGTPKHFLFSNLWLKFFSNLSARNQDIDSISKTYVHDPFNKDDFLSSISERVQSFVVVKESVDGYIKIKPFST